MRIFISHSNRDLAIAELLIVLLRLSLNLRSEDIRCTSVDGYRLPGGAPIDETLRREVHDAEVFIGLITPYSIQSSYVMFELGARWGAEKMLIPLLASGAGTQHLRGPLSGFNALNCSIAGQVYELVDQAADKLSVEPGGPAGYLNALTALVTSSSGELSEIGERGSGLLTRFDPSDDRSADDDGPTLDTRDGRPILRFLDYPNQTAVFAGIVSPVYRGSGFRVRIHFLTTSIVASVQWQVSLRRDLVEDYDRGSGSSCTILTPCPAEPLVLVTADFEFRPPVDQIGAGDPFRLLLARESEDEADTMATAAEVVAIELFELQPFDLPT